MIFRKFTHVVDLQQIEIPSIISKSVTDSTILSHYNIMVCEAELEPVPHISVLYSIINLYVCVHSFSLAKDIIE